MHSYYHFVRKTRRFSLIVLMNAGLLALMFFAAETYLIDDGFDSIVLIAVAIIECMLLGVAIYLWLINKQVEVRVSAKEFYYHDPLFGSEKLTIAVSDIVAIEQIQSASNRISRNLLRLKDGTFHELMYQNYNIDRQAMFDALKKANNNIKLPESIWAYRQTRPTWAKAARKRIGLDD